MYIPPAFRVEDSEKITAFIQRYSFATLITHDGEAPFASHLPMLFHPGAGSHGTLVSHMARSNPQWQHFCSGEEVLVIFHGPHSYISPSWYETALAVPTWNYATVHAYGVPTVLNGHERVVSVLDELVAAHEAAFERPWTGNVPEEFRDKLIQGIVAFEIPVSRIEGKFKLGQNRSEADTRGVIDALSRSPDAGSQAMAQMMVTECKVNKSA
ncbi:MAG: FMN-binding negative transcriptional regulator [Verrucomicrobiaceae bacterium]|nr:FMN-binding negative transcriptional regulator [Verrucomicrobiaceae bacterium]